MNTDTDKFDSLFENKLADYQVNDSNDNWYELDMKLSKQNFMKFSFFHFNIYYVVAFSLTLLLSLLNGALYFSNFVPRTTEPTDVINKSELHEIENGNNKIDSMQPLTGKPLTPDKGTPVKNEKPSFYLRYDSVFLSKDKKLVRDSVAKVMLPDTTVITSKSQKSQPENKLIDSVKPKKFIVNEGQVIVRDTVIEYQKRKKLKKERTGER